MSQPGDVVVPATLSIRNNAPAPIVRTNEALGSIKIVQDLTARDAIPTHVRVEGMLCFVVDADSFFQLKGGISNSFWASSFLGGAPPGTPLSVIRPYASGVLIREAVYQRADGFVDRASASSLATAPAIGVVSAIDSPSVGLCIVQYAGDLTGFTGLVSGTQMILGQTPGSIVPETDSSGFPAGSIIQEIGIAFGASGLFVGTNRDFDQI